MAKNSNPSLDKVGRRNTVILFLCIIIVFITIILILTMPFIRARFDHDYRIVKDIPAPTQNDTNGGTALSGQDWTGIATYRAEYDIQGLVINATEYNSGSIYDQITPLDIGFAWGDAAANNHLIKWVQGYRHVTASINALSKLYLNQDLNTIFQQYSNNHLVFKDEELLQKARTVKLGDYIRIKGYLIDITAYRDKEPAVKYKIKTSLTRYDDGEDSCEIILVTSLEAID